MIGITKYTNNGALAMTVTADEGEPIANITVSLHESMLLEGNCFFLSTSQTAKDIKDFWLKKCIIKKIDNLKATRSFNIYDSYEIVDPILKDEIRKTNSKDFEIVN